MKISRLALIIIFFFAVSLHIGCSGNNPDNENAANNSPVISSNPMTTKDNVEELAGIIKLEIVPDEVTYIETNLNNQNSERTVPGPNEKKLVAILKFSPEKAGQVVAQAEKHQPATAAEMSAESWYPAELIAQSQLTGDETLKGATYAANEFLQAPYNSGKLTRVENTNYFILELTTF